jgi:hypothetical protein
MAKDKNDSLKRVRIAEPSNAQIPHHGEPPDLKDAGQIIEPFFSRVHLFFTLVVQYLRSECHVSFESAFSRSLLRIDSAQGHVAYALFAKVLAL